MGFNESIAPFYWVEHKDLSASVCLTVYTMNTDIYKEEVFKMHGDKGFVGSGHDWAAVAAVFLRKELPELRGIIEFDPEHSMFCAYSSDREALGKFALSFRAACEDEAYLSGLCAQAGVEYDLLTETRPNSLLEIMRSGIAVPSVILRGNWDGADATLRRKCFDNKLFEFSGAVLEQHDLSEWMDVLEAPIFDYYPHGYMIEMELHDVAEQRVADFAELLRGWEVQAETLNQEQQKIGGLTMNSHQIWNQANEHLELIRSIYHALREGNDNKINAGMNQLKQHIPSLVGVDADSRALVFQSSDEGIVAVFAEEQGDKFALALATNIELDQQQDFGMGMQGM